MTLRKKLLERIRQNSARRRCFMAWEIALGIGVLFALTAGALAAASDGGLSDKLVRLHVVGASDSEADQALKLLVRDKTLELLEYPLESADTAEDAQRIIAENIPVLEEALQTFVRGQGADQTVAVKLQTEAFPTRVYDTFSLPAGPYTALRVTLGKGEGRNWWCVVFPPLCAASVMEHDSSLAAGLTESDIALITQADEEYVLRFKIAEWLGSFKNKLFGKR